MIIATIRHAFDLYLICLKVKNNPARGQSPSHNTKKALGSSFWPL